MNFIINNRLILAIILLPLLTGCLAGPTYQKPNLKASLQESWIACQQFNSPKQIERIPSQQAWWNQFNDPHLKTLIDELVSSNLTLAHARERVVAARARRGIANAARFPQVNIESDYTHTEAGDKAVSMQGTAPAQSVDIYRLGTVAGWEVDFWGRVERLIEAEDRSIEAEYEALNSIAISLISEMTLVYIEARILEERIKLIDEKIDLSQEMIKLTVAKEVAGNGTRFDRVMAQKQLQQVLALKPDLQKKLNVALNGIDALLGKTAQGKMLPIGDVPQVPALLGIGVPADLLVRRADIREAERKYAAAVAQIGVAMADKYPRISLSGSFYLQNDSLGDVFNPESFIYSFGPKIQFPLFSGGRIESQIDVRKSQAEQARLNLEQTLIAAVKEVEDAMISVVRTQESLQKQNNVVDFAHEGQEMAKHLYDTGLESLGQLISADRELINSKESLIIARQNALKQTVLLYRSLGGGWAAINMGRVAENKQSISDENLKR